MKKTLIFVILGIVLAACKTQSEISNIFEDPACEPPCWENIIPGVTTKEEALLILSDVDVVDWPVSDLNRPVGNFDDEIRFTLFKDNNSFTGSILVLDNLVSMLAFESELNLTLRRSIELFGMPKSVLVVRSGEFDALVWLDSQNGIAFGYKFHFEESSEISPDNKIDYLIFFDSQQYQMLLDTGYFSYHQLDVDDTIKRMLPWGGYGDIEQYLPTLTP